MRTAVFAVNVSETTDGARNAVLAPSAVPFAIVETVARNVQWSARDALKNVPTVLTKTSARDVIPALTVLAAKICSVQAVSIATVA